MQPDATPDGALDVLVVDDIASSRRSLADLVDTLGHRVVVAADGESALKRVRERPPDLVLLDLLMPDLDGFEVTRRIRAIASDRWLPVIVMSSLQGDEHFCEALRQGADDFLARPVTPELLDAKLRHYRRVLELQRMLATAAQRQRDIHDNIRDAVITFDDRARVTDINVAACRLFGDGTPAGLLGVGCEQLTGLGWDALLSSREAKLTAVDGRGFPAEIGCSEWLESGTRRVTVVIRDLTERRAVEQLKDEFLATVSHELRTPLTSILGAVGLVAAGKAGPIPAAAQPLIEMASRNAHRLGRLIDDLLDLTKIESDRMAIHARELPVGKLLDDVVDANRGYAERHAVALVRSVPADDEDALLRVDPDRFLQVMANLVSNAIKHSPANAAVTIGAVASLHGVRITVRDRGPGIPAEFRQRMFEKFSQADGSDQRRQAGTGLGLYVSRLLVEKMGGRIGAAEAPGGGSEFSLDLPRAGVAAAPGRALLWMVDRDLDAIRRLRLWAEPRWRVEAATDLDQALGRGFAEAPAVVIADPQGQGSADDFCAGLRTLAQGRPVVLYSDAVDDPYATAQGTHRLSKSRADAGDLERCLLRIGATRAAGSRPA